MDKIWIDNQEDVSITALIDQVKNIFLDRMNRIYRMGSASPTVECGRLSQSTVVMLRYGYLSNITVCRRSRPHPVNPVHPVKKNTPVRSYSLIVNTICVHIDSDID